MTERQERIVNLVATFIFTALVAGVAALLIAVGNILATRSMLAVFCGGLFCAVWRAAYVGVAERKS